jgi:hypothetical protein
MFHTEIQSRWTEFTIHEQMANIGLEVGRVFSWKRKSKNEMSINAFYRSLELIDLTIKDEKNIKRLKELCRMREFLVDNVKGDNQYNFTETEWSSYFSPFLFAARNK